jgi:glycine cleavage system H lipoate-binding protein
MASKVVDYKLCDRKFDCDNCLFDRAMRNTMHSLNLASHESGQSKGHSIVQRIISSMESEDFKSSYIYFGNHLMVKNLFANTYYFGFSPVVLNLLDDFGGVEYCNKSENVKKGDSILNVTGSWGAVSITAPFSFNCLGKISEQDDKSGNERWFSIIEAPREELMENSVPISEYHRDIVAVTKELTQLPLSCPEVGLTMLDGGFDVRFLYEAIGKENYIKILNSLFHKKSTGKLL